MNNDNKQSMNAIPPQHFYPSMYQQRNTINFGELWRILAKQKKIIAITLLASLVLGVALALTKPLIYSFSTIVQIGTVAQEGKSELIESTDTALNKTISAYIPFVLTEFYDKNSADRGQYMMSVSVPKKSDLLIVEAKGAVSQESVYKELIDSVVKKLIDDHSRIANLKIKNYEVSIAHAENVLASGKDMAKLISANTERVEKTAELLRTQLAEKKQMLANTLKNRSHVSSSSATGAMSILLIDSEIQRYQQMIDQLEKHLLIDLNQQRNELEKALSDNLREQNDEQNTIDQLKNALANISNTKAVVPVMTSTEPVGMSKFTLVLIITLLGGLLGITLAFLYDFFQQSGSKKTSAKN
jgi:uncharacterized protein involved in exopolysaccharide biosynthesis